VGRRVDGVGEKGADRDHDQHGQNESAIAHPLKPVHAPHRARTQGAIRKKARNEKKKRVPGEEIVRQSVGFPKRDHHANQPNYR
jgi:hypothetical protein